MAASAYAAKREGANAKYRQEDSLPLKTEKQRYYQKEGESDDMGEYSTGRYISLVLLGISWKGRNNSSRGGR
jgi:hypothetical protein